MKVVYPLERTTLMLTEHYMPMHVATAKAAFNQLLRHRVKAVDSNGVLYNWDEWNNRSDSTYEVEYLEDQPCLRSAHNQWPIPTIAITTSRYFFKVRKNQKVNRRALMRRYNYTCQICYKEFRGEKAKYLTIEHVYPRSKGGANEEYNCVITCKKCNNKKGDIYPWHDINGKILEPKKAFATGFFMPDEDEIRDEWRPYLFLSEAVK